MWYAKKPLSFISAVLLCLLLLSFSAAALSEPFKAVLARQSLIIDGVLQSGVEIYNINGETYYRLRDMAMLLGGTRAEFGVDYNGLTKTISVKKGAEYVPVGYELSAFSDRSASCVQSSQSLLIDGVLTSLKAYNLGGSNFFRLRDLGPALDFGVDYDEARNAVLIDTKSALTRVRLGTSDFFISLPSSYSPRETGGYASADTNVSLDIYEQSGVSSCRAFAEKELLSLKKGGSYTLSTVSFSGFDLLFYAPGSSRVYYLDAGNGLCEKLVFTADGKDGEISALLSTLEKPLRVRLGASPLSLYLPSSFKETATGGTASQALAFTDGNRYVEIRVYGDITSFDSFLSLLGEKSGADESLLKSLSLITKYYTPVAAPAENGAPEKSFCMPCAVNLGGKSVSSVIFKAENANFGWALKILRSLSAS